MRSIKWSWKKEKKVIKKKKNLTNWKTIKVLKLLTLSAGSTSLTNLFYKEMFFLHWSFFIQN